MLNNKKKILYYDEIKNESKSAKTCVSNLIKVLKYFSSTISATVEKNLKFSRQKMIFIQFVLIFTRIFFHCQ